MARSPRSKSGLPHLFSDGWRWAAKDRITPSLFGPPRLGLCQHSFSSCTPRRLPAHPARPSPLDLWLLRLGLNNPKSTVYVGMAGSIGWLLLSPGLPILSVHLAPSELARLSSSPTIIGSVPAMPSPTAGTWGLSIWPVADRLGPKDQDPISLAGDHLSPPHEPRSGRGNSVGNGGYHLWLYWSFSSQRPELKNRAG